MVYDNSGRWLGVRRDWTESDVKELDRKPGCSTSESRA
jgi:hypothetical protein